MCAGPVPGPCASTWPRRRPRAQVSGRFSSEPAVASSPPANAQLLLAEVRLAEGLGANGGKEGEWEYTPGPGEREPASGVAAETSTPGAAAVACRGLRRHRAALPRGGGNVG